VLEELEAISHPNEEQERLRELLRTTSLKAHDGTTRSRIPAVSARQEVQSQRRSAFERLGPNGSHDRGSRKNHTQSNQVNQKAKWLKLCLNIPAESKRAEKMLEPADKGS